ncbi:MAG: peptidylprolyl isomerase [Gemmatimonadetes bacterium]|nr:peptidylprolyl isomerase [Gemmatimonadota bacterium]
MSSFFPRSRPIGSRFPFMLLATAALITAGGCGLSDAMSAHTDVVARAGGKEFRVADAVELLSLNPQIPAEPQVVRALADLWVDYMLLATAVAEDSTLASVNLDGFTQTAREQALVMKLRDQVIRADTVFSDAQLTQRWASEGPGAEIRAAHILLRIPAEATPAQRDSVQKLAESIRQRAAGGEEFGALARQYSADPSAAQGGDLGFFGRGRMVAPFEEAAFKLQPGQVSPVIESPFGLHVIRLTERRQTEMGDQREQFRQYLVGRAHEEAETTYLDSISKSANVKLEEGGLAVIREVAGKPETALRGRAGRREIATYTGGAFTTGEFLDFVRTQPAQVQSMFTTASDEQLENAVQQLTRKELLLRQAEARNIKLTRAEEDSIRSEARQAIRAVVEGTGFTGAAGRGANAEAIATQVKQLLRAYISGQVQLVPLAAFGYILRDLYPNEINEAAFPQVVEQVAQARAAQPAPTGPGMPDPSQHGGTPAPGQPGMPDPSQQVPPAPGGQGAPAPSAAPGAAPGGGH